MDLEIDDLRGTARDPRIIVDELPGFSGIVGPVESRPPLRIDRREQTPAVARRHCDADASQPVLVERRQSLVQRPPRPAAISRLEDAGAFTTEVRVLPWSLPRL